MLSSKSVRRMFICLVLLLPAITGISTAGQSSSTLCAPTSHAVVLDAPESNLERSEIETLGTAKVSVDVAMYSFTGLKRQDNDVHYEMDTTLAALFEARFEAMWD